MTNLRRSRPEETHHHFDDRERSFSENRRSGVTQYVESKGLASNFGDQSETSSNNPLFYGGAALLNRKLTTGFDLFARKNH